MPDRRSSQGCSPRATLPLGRVTTTEEVAAAVLHLASDDAASTVGTDLVVDSGATA